MTSRRDAWPVVEAAAREIDAQLHCQGAGSRIHVCDHEGRIHVNGTIDLAALAVAIEAALIDFYEDNGPEAR